MSSIFQLSTRDLLKGLVVAVFTSVFTLLSSIIQNNGFALSQQDWKLVAAMAVTSALGYLTKQFVTDENGKIGGKL